MDGKCEKVLNYASADENVLSDADHDSINFILNNCTINKYGRLELPALWNPDQLQRLPSNFNLSHNLLNSLIKKLNRSPNKLSQYDEVIKKQMEDGIIEMVDLNSVQNDPLCSFLSHGAVFRENVESTKCRVVYWSNLSEKGCNNLSHNQVSLPGPNLNGSIQSVLTLLRFNKYLLVFDLVKAFHQLCLREEDCKKLNFLWYNDISDQRTLVAYRLKRVPFGMRFSPFLLMISLYIMLILHANIISEKNSIVRNMLFNLSYMDNIAFSGSSPEEISEAYKYSHEIFSSYCFELQQFASNCNSESCSIPYENESVKNLFGILWDLNDDSYSPKSSILDLKAKSKRQILSSINSVFDPLGMLIPLLNRAKLFLHSLQCQKGLTWDEGLSREQLQLWNNICKQFNKSVTPSIPRYVGRYKSTYNIVAFSDASKEILGCVIYLQDCETKEYSFGFAKNKMLNSSLSCKSIPILELCALAFACQTMMDFYGELINAFNPVVISDLHVFTDSMISINWITNKILFQGKIERKGALVNNKLDLIVRLADKHSISFNHVGGHENPADCVTRCMSSNVLKKKYFYSCPDVEFDGVIVPPCNVKTFSVKVDGTNFETVLPIDKFSSFKRLCNVTHYVRKFIYNLKLCVNAKRGSNIQPVSNISYSCSCDVVIRAIQTKYFSEEFNYLISSRKLVKAAPLITQLNLFIDENKIIRVRGKMNKLNASFAEKYPVLLPRNSVVISSIILDIHLRMRHCGVYKLLHQFRKEFYVTSAYSLIKTVLGKCLVCKKVNGRTIPINRNSYKDYRINPSKIPFREVALDHIGPFSIKNDSKKDNKKVYVLIVTCFFTRAVNLIICKNIDNESFLLAIQSHIFQFGVPSRILSDNGSPIVSSINSISKYLENPEIKNFLTENNIRTLSFEPYPPNASYLGGIVESLVKQVKFMVYSSLGKNIISYFHFDFLIKEINMLINKRPFTCKSSLIDPSIDSTALVLTPEMLIKGYEVPTLSVIPQFDSEVSDNELWNVKEDKIVNNMEKLIRVRKNLINYYSDKFIGNLLEQSTNKLGAYQHKKHTTCNVGDLVVIKQKNCKPYSCPSGIVTNVETNDLDENVCVSVRKANGEILRRHVTDIIFLEKGASTVPVNIDVTAPSGVRRSKRIAAKY